MRDKQIVNLTPHSINIGGREFPPSGQIARVGLTSKEVGDFDGVPLVESTYGEVDGLPDEEHGTLLIVLEN